jgi:hypothetical protein
MAPKKKVLVTNVRKTGAKVPPSWNAKMMTSAKAAPKTGTIPVNRKPSTPKPKPASTPSPRIKVPAEFNAKMMTSAKGKPKAGTIPAPRKPANKPAGKPAGKPSGVRTGQPANIKGALPAAGKTGGNQANAAKSARVARMQARRAAEAAAGKPSGVRTGQPAGAANRMYGVNAVNAAVKRAQGSAMLGKVGKFGGKVGKFGGKLLGPVAVASDAFFTAKDVFNPKDNIIHDLGNLGTAVENAISGKDSGRRYSGNSLVAKAGNIKRGLNKPPSKPAAKPAAGTSKFADARDKAFAKAKAIKGSPVVGPKTASAPARMSAPAARSSAPSAPRAAAAPKASAPKASAPKSAGPVRMSASTYNRVSGNYGTSRTNNPLMADFKDSLPSKAADPDAGYSPKTKVSSKNIKGAPTDVTKLAFSNPKLSAERTRKIKRG